MTDLRREYLRDLLQRYECTQARELVYKQRMLSLCAAREPFSRSHFNPGHFTASAFVLSPDQKSLLLILHGKLNIWVQPGGHIDAGDADVLSAARRELLEETGLSELLLCHDGFFDLDIHAIPANLKEPAHEHFDLRFLFRAQTWDLCRSEEVKDQEWVPLCDLASKNTDDSVLGAAAKISRWLARAARRSG